MNDIPDDNNKTRVNPRRSRALLKLWWVILVILALSLYWLNGAGGLWIIGNIIKNELQKNGLKGGWVISGSLVNGLNFHDLNISGNNYIDEIKIDKLSINWTLKDLIFKNKIDYLGGNNILIKLNSITEKKESETKPNTEGGNIENAINEIVSQLRKGSDSLIFFQEIYEKSTIDISNIKIIYTQNYEKDFLAINQVKKSKGSSKMSLIGYETALYQHDSIPQDIEIVFETENLKIEKIEIFYGIFIENLNLRWSQHAPLTLSASIYKKDICIHLALNQSGHLEIILDQGAKVDGELLMLFGLHHDKFRFDLQDFKIKIPNIYEQINQWQVQAEASLAGLCIDAFKADTVKLFFSGSPEKGNFKIKTHPEESQIAIFGNFFSENGLLNQTQSSMTILFDLTYAMDADQMLSDVVSKYFNLEQLENITLNFRGSSKGKLSLGQNHIQCEECHTDLFINQLNYSGNYLPAISLKIFSTDNWKTSLELTSLLPTEILHLNTNFTPESGVFQGELFFLSNTKYILQIINQIQSYFDLHSLQLQSAFSGNWKEQTIDLASSSSGLIGFRDSNQMIGFLQSSQSQWPLKINHARFQAASNDMSASVQLSWNEGYFLISEGFINIKDKPIKISGKIPFEASEYSLENLFSSKKPMLMNIEFSNLSIYETLSYFPFLNKYHIKGYLDMSATIQGTPSQPVIDLKFDIKQLHSLWTHLLGNLDIAVLADVSDQRLQMTGSIDSQYGRLIDIEFSSDVPEVKKLFNGSAIQDYVLDANLKATSDNFSLITLFLPDLISRAEGFFSCDLDVSGNVSSPRINGRIGMSIPTLITKDADWPNPENFIFNADFVESQILIQKLSCSLSGGSISISGSVDIADIKDPIFDISLKASEALIYRDSNTIIRSNADVSLLGAFSEAILKGNIALIESLYFRDIELFAFADAGSGDVEAGNEMQFPVNLENSFFQEIIPQTFQHIRLDMGVKTEDDFLIRGNIARGRISCDLRLSETLAKPNIEGRIEARELVLKLPFSVLRSESASLSFNRNQFFDPYLVLRAISTISGYEVSIFVFGNISQPTVSFSSNPPLDETDILSLLATGTVVTGLVDRQNTALRGAQFFLQRIQSYASRPGGNKLFSRMLGLVSEANITLGAEDPLTSRLYNSATLDLTSNWSLAAQFDRQNNARGLLIFLIRFR